MGGKRLILESGFDRMQDACQSLRAISRELSQFGINPGIKDLETSNCSPEE